MMRCLLFTASCVAVLLAVPACGAGTMIDAVEVGFSGHYKAGAWTPLDVQLAAQASSAGETFLVQTETIDADGSTVSRTSPPIAAEAIDDEIWLRTVFQAGRLGSGLTVRILAPDGEPIAEKRLRSGTDALPTALTSDVPLWLSAVPLPERDPELESTWSADLRVVELSGPLPIDPMAYQAVDLLLLPGDVEASNSGFEAVRRYVAGGGRLAISLGERTPAFAESPLADWVPVEIGGTIQLREFSDLENFAKSQRRLPARARIRIASITSATENVVPWTGSDQILVAREPFGFGEITIFAIDLGHVTFANWTGLPAFIERAVRRPHERMVPAQSIGNVSELATQLLRAEDRFPDLSRLSVGRALLLLLVYAVIVGPLDYVIVHRWLGRPALTWITLPLIVAGAAWWLNSRAIATNGTQSQFNQLTVFDHDLASGTTRGRSIVTLYAAQAARTDLTLAPTRLSAAADDAESLTARLGWLAAPEETFGGLYRDAAGGLFRPKYSITGGNAAPRAHDIPLLVWSSRQFATEWQTTNDEIAISADLASSGRGFLEGTIEHGLPVPIQDWMVVFGNQVYLPRERAWEPGAPLLLNSRAFSRRDARALLTGQTQVAVEKEAGDPGAEYFVTETAYDQDEIDPATIVRMLSFHESAGGRTYTKLDNTLWSAEDLTPLLNLGRAVLWGEIDLPQSTVTITSESDADFEASRKRTFIRIILPVEAADSESAQLAGE